MNKGFTNIILKSANNIPKPLLNTARVYKEGLPVLIKAISREANLPYDITKEGLKLYGEELGIPKSFFI